MWSLNKQLQYKSVKIYRAQTPQNLALTKILHKLRKTSTPPIIASNVGVELWILEYITMCFNYNRKKIKMLSVFSQLHVFLQ